MNNEFAQTVGDMGRIYTPREAVDLVKDFYVIKNTGLVTVLRLNKNREVIGISHNKTDLDLAWRLGTVHDAVNENGCSSMVVLYDGIGCAKKIREMASDILDLKSKLNCVGVSLANVISIDRRSFYSWYDERAYSL